ncbi:hypothetical protein BGZ76_011229, partial [Entomortierella beljakovae]
EKLRVMAYSASVASVPITEYTSLNNGASLFMSNTPQAKEGNHELPQNLEQQQQHQKQQQKPVRVSTKALAITSCASSGTPPPPLIGSATVLVNDSAMHCFGGRLESRTLTNCHYVLDVDTGAWETIHQAPESSDKRESGSLIDLGGKTTTEIPNNISLSLTTDPAETDSGPLSGIASVRPSPRYFHTINAFGTTLILFGGMGKAQGSDNLEKEKDTDSKEQDELEDPRLRAGEKEAGNQGSLQAFNDLWTFDIVSQRWQQRHPPINTHSPRPRWAHMAIIMDHYLIVIGGTDALKVYVEDACVLDLHSWEWVATIPNIGQCGSYRTVAATGPSKQASTTVEPAVSSFPSAGASSPQTSSNLARPFLDSGSVDPMASISMVLTGRISAPSSTSSSTCKDDDTIDTPNSPISKRKLSERMLSGELTPAFRSGRDVPSIYLYSNYNFSSPQRDFKVITPHYTHPTVSESDTTLTTSAPVAPPSFSLIEKSQALKMMEPELPPGLRFPQGHIYQNQLILTGTLIVPGSAPTLAIYSFNLTHYRWERLDTDNVLQVGSWNRTMLHPATGTLLVFGNHDTDPKRDYANRLQHHNHFMLIDLQAYGLYDRPIPSLPQAAQDLGQDLLAHPSLCDMHVASVTGTLFGANSTVLASRWPEFSSLLLSPPYVTPLILVLPVPDEVVPIFLQYLYTGALPFDIITAGIADYLLILAKKYELNGLYALTMDVLHQTVHLRPVRVYSSALLAGELGLQARSVGLAMIKNPGKPSHVSIPTAGMAEGKDLPPLPSPTSTIGSSQGSLISRAYSGRVPPLPPHASGPASSIANMHRRQSSNQSRESISTDGGFVVEGLIQQYNAGVHIPSSEHSSSSFEPRRQLSVRTPPSFGKGSYMTPVSSPIYGPSGSIGTSYSSPHSPSSSYSSQQITIHEFEEHHLDDRNLQARRRLQQQMQQEPDLKLTSQQQLHNIHQQQHYAQQHQDYLQQQQLLLEQQQMRDQELLLMEQHRLEHHRYLQKQHQFKAHQLQVEQPANVLNEIDYHFGGGGVVKASSSFRIRSPNEMQSSSSGNSAGSGRSEKEKEKDKKKDKKLMAKMKPPKPTLSGAELMKSAGF